MSKNVVDAEPINDVTVWRLHVAYWISKAVRTQSHAHSNAPGNPHSFLKIVPFLISFRIIWVSSHTMHLFSVLWRVIVLYLCSCVNLIDLILLLMYLGTSYLCQSLCFKRFTKCDLFLFSLWLCFHLRFVIRYNILFPLLCLCCTSTLIIQIWIIVIIITIICLGISRNALRIFCNVKQGNAHCSCSLMS